MKKEKGIFCIEGMWEKDLRDKKSVYPILDLLQRVEDIPFIYKDAAISGEFEFYLKKWTQQRYKEYPILYLAFHGLESCLMLGDGNYELEDMSNILAGKCDGTIIVFGSCNTLSIDKRYIKNFLYKTGALAVCGYGVDVAWTESSAFELMLLSVLQENEFTGRGLASIKKKAYKISKKFPEFQFRMVTRKELV